MRIVRCTYEGQTYYGRVDGDTVALSSDFPAIRVSGGTKEIVFGKELKRVSLANVTLLAPCQPRKAVCVGLNYRDHADEFGHAYPTSPVLFIKPSTSLLNPGDKIQYPSLSKRVDYEAELVAVIGATAKNVPIERALEHVLGYTCGNDVTARDLQPQDGQWTVAKSFDTFMPLGPWIETDVDPCNLGVRSVLNGQLRQSSSTKYLIFSVAHLVSYISQIMTLEPGDVIMTGTPSGVGPMQPGDTIRIEIDGIGSLENSIA